MNGVIRLIGRINRLMALLIHLMSLTEICLLSFCLNGHVLAACAAAATVPLFPLAWCFAGPVIWDLWTTECIACLADTSEGAEMMVAIQEGRRCGSQLYAIDRDSDTTNGRCLAELDIGSILTVLKFLQGLFVDRRRRHFCKGCFV